MNSRYVRQVALPEVGEAGQAQLAAARVLVVGAGGLGCPVLQYLAGAGVGRITVMDDDKVEESNLHRQPLFSMADIGAPKVTATRAALLRLNPSITVDARAQRLSPAVAGDAVGAVDVVVDATDNLTATYILSDACHEHGKPLVSASALGLSGYVGAFCGGAPSYRAVFPDMPERAATCNSAGVLGSVVGTIGCLQAQFVLQLILAIAPSPLGRLLSFDASRLAFGGFRFDGAREPEWPLQFIDADRVVAQDVVVDLRSVEEAPVSPLNAALRFTPERIDAFATEHPPSRQRIVLCCHSGLRAWRVARHLQARGYASLALVALAGVEP